MFPYANGSSRHEGRAQRQTSHHQRVDSSDTEGVPSALGEARGVVLLQAARGSPSQEEVMEARGDFISVSGELVYHHLVMPRIQLYVPTESSFPLPIKFIDVVGEPETNVDHLEETMIDDFWTVDESQVPSDSWSGPTRFRIITKRPPKVTHE